MVRIGSSTDQTSAESVISHPLNEKDVYYWFLKEYCKRCLLDDYMEYELTIEQVFETLNTYRWINRFSRDKYIVVNVPSANRNPQGLSLDPASGKMWEHEHGPQGGDEVNIVKKGANYGWPAITFGIDYDNSIISEDTARAGMEQPVIYWRPSIAPCGMTFVTSPKFPDWKGDLLVGSLKFNYIMHCTVKGDQITRQEKILEGIGRVRTIRQGADGNIYVVAENSGSVFRVSPM